MFEFIFTPATRFDVVIIFMIFYILTGLTDFAGRVICNFFFPNWKQ